MFRVWDTRELEMHRSGLLFHNGKPFVGLRCWDDEHDEYSDGEKEYRAGVMWGDWSGQSGTWTVLWRTAAEWFGACGTASIVTGTRTGGRCCIAI